MKLLILTQYYPPETGAPQNRLHSMALNLTKKGNEVEVLTAMPHYPKMEVFDRYKDISYLKESIDGIHVHRAKIFTSKRNGVIIRLLNYFSFVISSLLVFKKIKNIDYVFCESPPLFLGISALFMSKKLNAKLIFNVSDLWPESAEKLNIVKNRFFLNLAYILEEFIYKKSFLITCQTKGILKNINSRFPNLDTFWLPNGIDKDVYNVDEDKDWIDKYNLSGKKIYIYAGIVGHAQGLEVIIKAKKWLMKNNVEVSEKIKLVIVGDGPEKNTLLTLNKELNTNILFIPNTPKEQLIRMLKSCQGYIVPLKKIDLFLGAIPSKIFDALALSIPLLLGVDGEAKSLFINSGKSGVFFEPENYKSLAKAIVYLEKNPDKAINYGISGNAFAMQNFDRKKIVDNFIDKIESLEDEML